MANNYDDDDCTHPLTRNCELGWNFPFNPYHPMMRADDSVNTHPLLASVREGVGFNSLLLQMMTRMILVVNTPLPNGCAIPSRRAHQRQLMSGLHPRGIYAKPMGNTCMGLCTHGTCENPYL